MNNARALAWALVGLLTWLVGYPLLLTLFEAFGGLADPTINLREELTSWASEREIETD